MRQRGTEIGSKQTTQLRGHSKGGREKRESTDKDKTRTEIHDKRFETECRQSDTNRDNLLASPNSTSLYVCETHKATLPHRCRSLPHRCRALSSQEEEITQKAQRHKQVRVRVRVSERRKVRVRLD